MKIRDLLLSILVGLPLLAACSADVVDDYSMFPEPGAVGVAVDANLVLTFHQEAEVGTSGKIYVYDASSDQLADCIDLSIPAGPTEIRQEPEEPVYVTQPYSYSRSKVATNLDTKPGTPSHPEAVETPAQRGNYQLTIIGGFTDGFHFYPVMARDSVVTIQLHHNKLQYGHRYYVVIDEGVIRFTDGSIFKGVRKEDGWTFATKGNGPSIDRGILTVRKDGTGDFCTIQGALDYVPDSLADTLTIKIGPGMYEEIVYFRNKTHLRIQGAGKDRTILRYTNNETFNPHPLGITTNEKKGTFPSRRAVMSVDNCDDISIEDMAIINDTEKGQSEGLLIHSERVAVRRCYIKGDRDAFQANGTTFAVQCDIEGGHDMIMSRGALYAYRCSFRNQGGPFAWPRNDHDSHGLVFVECSFSGISERISDYGRTNSNKGRRYPYAEMVLINCRESNVSAGGWSVIGGDECFVAEYNTRNKKGELIDAASRHPRARWLDAEKDGDLIKKYTDPAFVLKGWNPGASNGGN